MRKLSILLLIVVLIFPLMVFSKIGVGVGTGKIEVDKPLRPGEMSILPSIGVVNTGDEPADYGIRVTHRFEQPQLQPLQEWFTFDPSLFHLEPGRSQSVAVKLELPVKTKPGDYFAFLEAHPIIKAEPGVVTISVAAATKLYFTVAPANIWQGIYYRISSFLKMYSPWSWVVLALIAGAAIIVALKALFKKFFKLQIKISKK